MDLEVSGVSIQVTFEVTETRIATLEIREDPQHISSTLGSGLQGTRRFRAFATYSDGGQADVTELGSWCLEDATKATMSDDPGSRGSYLLGLGGNTAVHFTIAGEASTLEWSFPANP